MERDGVGGEGVGAQPAHEDGGDGEHADFGHEVRPMGVPMRKISRKRGQSGFQKRDKDMEAAVVLVAKGIGEQHRPNMSALA